MSHVGKKIPVKISRFDLSPAEASGVQRRKNEHSTVDGAYHQQSPAKQKQRGKVARHGRGYRACISGRTSPYAPVTHLRGFVRDTWDEANRDLESLRCDVVDRANSGRCASCCSDVDIRISIGSTVKIYGARGVHHEDSLPEEKRRKT